MKVVFFSNFLNHHQYPFCKEMVGLLGETNFVFVSTIPMPEAFKATGYPAYLDEAFHLKAFSSEEEFEKAKKIGLEADVVIIGSANKLYIQERLKENKLTFYYSERWFKTRIYKINFIKKLYNLWKDHIQYRNKNLYMLCASAFQSGDCKSVFAYPHKTYKWGYFPAVPDHDINTIIKNRINKTIKILWCARMINWKHPELAVLLAEKLKKKGYNFEIEMIGHGEMSDEIQRMIKEKSLEDCVFLSGVHPNDKVIDKMKQSHIFLFTSDRNEGWGAVLNEAMSNGCAVIVSDKVGAAPYLIDNNQNGVMFRSGSLTSLLEKIEIMIRNRQLIDDFSAKAYQTMSEIWNPKNAANKFVILASALLDDKSVRIEEGPCSKA